MSETIKIKVISTEVTNRGKYDQIEVTFKNLNFDGKVDAKDALAAVDIAADNAKAVRAHAEAVVKKPRKPKAATKKSADDRVE